MAGAERPEVLAYLALGANLGDAQATLRAATVSIAALPATRLVAASSLYRTAPLESTGPDYLNAVMAVATRLNAPELLECLQQIENLAGRERPYRNAPRTLDLDLLLYGHASIDSPALQVPHPRMFERAFVLLPLAEIAPDQVRAEQLGAVAGQVIERLAGPWC
ncbi:MAG: 2-amino-4-hydroxy-6-hydroxymethyldihydropteridine diphosphokinase [Rhodoferax sp.]|nr:2-amino-4-hydroxy-6-hydroxymethyldihydropteridine diphosphokinase [Rhodoferax sp.]